MKIRVFATILLALFCATEIAAAATFSGVSLPDRYQLNESNLLLNGQGMRKKFFFSIYVGALYTPTRVKTSKEVMNPELPKVIRLHFVYDEVTAQKLRDGFAESIDKNMPGFSTSEVAGRFLKLFNFPARSGEAIDLQFSPGGVLTVTHQGNTIGSITSAELCQAVLSIYFGASPIESLKEGMLGG